MNRYRLVHTTQFSYETPVSESFNEVRLRPMQDDLQSCLSFRLSTDPPSNSAYHLDYFGNYVHRFNVSPKHRSMCITADSVVLVQNFAPMPEHSPGLKDLGPFQDEIDGQYDFLTPTTYTPHEDQLRNLASRIEAECDGSCAGYALAAMHCVHRTFRYERGATHVQSSIRDTLVTGAGVCQDFAHIMLALVRLRGLPGRYVSGYIVPRSAAEPGASVEEVIGGQASHAWTEVFIPGAGWIGFDPTLGALTGMQHVRVAYGRDYGDVAPVRGVYKGQAGQHLSVDVRVRPALDDEGREHLKEAAPALPEPVPDAFSQQPEQQQQ